MGEPDTAIGRVGGIVVSFDIEHSVAEPPVAEPVEPGERHRYPEALAVESGVDGDDEDLTQWGFVVGVDLRPAKSGQAVIDVMQAETLRLEPWLGHRSREVLVRAPALLRMPAERSVVDLDQLAQIGHLEGSSGDGGSRRRQSTSQMPQIAARNEAMGFGDRVVGRIDVTDPELNRRVAAGSLEGADDEHIEIVPAALVRDDDNPAKFAVGGTLDSDQRRIRIRTHPGKGSDAARR